MKVNSVIIQGIQKPKSYDIHIHYEIEEEVEQLRKLQWEESYNGLQVHQRKFGTMIDEVSMKIINTKEL